MCKSVAEYNKLMRERSDIISHNRSTRMTGRNNIRPVPTKPDRPKVLQAFNDDGYICTFPIGFDQAEATKMLLANKYILDTVKFKTVDAN